MARSTRLVILIKNIYTLWGRKRFLFPVTYFPTNLVYPFTLRVTGINTHITLTKKPNLYYKNEKEIIGLFLGVKLTINSCHIDTKIVSS